MENTERPQLPEILGVSSIALACKSLKHYHWDKVLKKREETPAMKEGTQLHTLTLEPEKFYANYCTDLDLPKDKIILKTIDDMKSIGKDLGLKLTGKKDEITAQLAAHLTVSMNSGFLFYDEWVEEQTRNKEFISKTKWEALHGMRDSIMAHEYMRTHYPNAKKEVEIEGELDGIKIRGRLDFLVDDPELSIVLVMDVKKCQSAEYWPIHYLIKDNRYHVQAALYVKMIEDKYKKPCAFVWLFSEAKGPHITECYECDTQMAEAGIAVARQAMKRIRRAYETNSWPGYTEGRVNHMSLPEAEYARAEDVQRMMEAEANAEIPEF